MMYYLSYYIYDRTTKHIQTCYELEDCVLKVTRTAVLQKLYILCIKHQVLTDGDS